MITLGEIFLSNVVAPWPFFARFWDSSGKRFVRIFSAWHRASSRGTLRMQRLR